MAALRLPVTVAYASSLLGKYDIGRQLGEGAHGVVFEAKPVGSNRRVALKKINKREVRREEVLRGEIVGGGYVDGWIGRPVPDHSYSCLLSTPPPNRHTERFDSL